MCKTNKEKKNTTLHFHSQKSSSLPIYTSTKLPPSLSSLLPRKGAAPRGTSRPRRSPPSHRSRRAPRRVVIVGSPSSSTSAAAWRPLSHHSSCTSSSAASRLVADKVKRVLEQLLLVLVHARCQSGLFGHLLLKAALRRLDVGL